MMGLPVERLHEFRDLVHEFLAKTMTDSIMESAGMMRKVADAMHDDIMARKDDPNVITSYSIHYTKLYDIDINELVDKMRTAEGVNDIHHLHVWSICSHITALSAHIDIKPGYRLRQSKIIGTLERMLDHDYHITLV